MIATTVGITFDREFKKWFDEVPSRQWPERVRFEVPTELEQAVLQSCLKIRNRILGSMDAGMRIFYAGINFRKRKRHEIMIVLVRDFRDAPLRHLHLCKDVYPDWHSRERLCRMWEEHLKIEEKHIEDNLRCWRHNQSVTISSHKRKRKRTWQDRPVDLSCLER